MKPGALAQSGDALHPPLGTRLATTGAGGKPTSNSISGLPAGLTPARDVIMDAACDIDCQCEFSDSECGAVAHIMGHPLRSAKHPTDWYPDRAHVS